MITGLAIITFSAIVAALVEVYLHKQRRLRRSQGSTKPKPTVEQIFSALKHENDD